MIFSKLIAYSFIAGSFFAVSTVSTIGITQVINKTPVADVEEDEDDDDTPVAPVKLSNTQQLIVNLTSFGNMEAYVDASITYGEELITLNGNAFVSMESLGDVEIYADLDIAGFDKTMDLEVTYKDSILYASIDERKLSLNTNDLNDVITLINDLMPSGENAISSLLPNIDTDTLLANLGNMTSEEKEDEILYTCSLIDGFPPLYFTSDYDHQMTSVSIHDAEIAGLKISLDAKTNILGMDQNQVKEPEDKDSYIDVKKYFGIADQIKGYIEHPQFDISYNLNAYQNDNELVSTTGKLYLDLDNKLNFAIDGNINAFNQNVNYLLGYEDNKAFVNIQDKIKAYVEENSLLKAKEDILTLVDNEMFSSLSSSLNNISLPLLDFIKAKDVKSLLSKYNYINIDEEGLTLSLSNSLFSNNDSDLSINLKVNENGLKTISISNLAYNEYHFDLSLNLNEFTALPAINYEEYFNADKYLATIPQIDNILKTKAGNFTYDVNVKENNNDFINLDGNVNLSFNDEFSFNVEGNISYKDNLSASYLLDINKDRTALKINDDHQYYINNDELISFINPLFKKLKNGSMNNLFNGLDALSIPLLTIINEDDYLSLIDYVDSYEVNENGISLNIKNSLFSSNEGTFNINVLFNEKGLDEIKVNNFFFNNLDISLSIKMSDYQVKEELDLNGYTNITSYLPLINQIIDIVSEKEVGLSYNVNLSKDNASIISTFGEVDLSFKDALEIYLKGALGEEEKYAVYELNINDVIALNYNDTLKVYIPLEDIAESINKLLPLIKDSFTSSLSSIKVEELLSYIDALVLKEDGIYLDVINPLNNEVINISFTKDGEEFKDIKVSGLSFNGYSLDLSLSLEEYHDHLFSKDDYTSLDRIPGIIDQILGYIEEKACKISFNVNYEDINVSGNSSIKFDNDVLIYLETTLLDKDDNSYQISLEKDNENYYLSFNETKVLLSTESVNSIIKDARKLLLDNDSVIYQYIVNIDLSNLKDYFYDLPITSINSNGNKLAAAININEQEFTLELVFNNEDHIKEINIKNDKLSGSISLSNYEEKHIEKTGKYIGGSSLKNVTSYFSNLSKENQTALIDQIVSYTDINNLSLGVDYSIKVTRDNNLTFTTSGDIDFVNNENETSFYLVGDLVNKENEEPLDSNFFISYQDDTIYFNYNDSLKIAYDKAAITDLIDIITTRLPLDDASLDTLANILPDGSTASSPLFTAIKNKEYLSLLDYFKEITIEGSDLVIHIDASILGNMDGELTIALDAHEGGLKSIKIKNIYAFGYVLDFDLSIREFKNHDFNKEGYVSLNYMNNIIDRLSSLISENKYALSLSGSINSLTFNGSTQFELGENKDRGIGKITLTDKSNKNHNIVIDVTRNKVSDTATEEEKRNALETSDVLFSYNNNLKGSFNLGSLSDTFSLVQALATEGNKRVEKYKDLLLADISSSVLMQVLNGNIEAILYQNLLDGIYYRNGNYDIELNGNFLKEDTNLDVSNIIITLKLDNNHQFEGIAFKGKLMDFDINLSLDLEEYDDNYTGLTKDSSYYDFSDMNYLVEYLLNTASKDDFDLSGKLNVKIFHSSLIKLGVDLNSYVHIDKDEEGNEKVYVKLTLSNIPYVPIASEKLIGWTERTFNIYFTDDEVYLDLVCYYNGITSIDSYNISKHTRLTLEDFLDNILYYLVNYGLGIKESIFDGSTYTTDSDNEIELSKLLSSYSFDESIPSWNLSINMDELTGTSIFDDLDVVISGDQSKLMKSLDVTSEIISIIDLNFDADVNNYDYDEARFNNILTYLANHQNDELGKTYKGANN